MKKRNIFTTILCTLLVLSLLTGCSLTGGKEPDDVITTNPDSDQTQNTTESKKADPDTDDYDEPLELTYLRLQMKENNDLVGVAYLDFLPDTQNVSEYSLAVDCSASATFDKYPFLERCPISLIDGYEMFAIVPASRNATITIYRSSIDEEGMTKDERDKPLFKSEDGSPIVVICNENENYSNILVCVEDGDEVVEFHPTMSLKNGRDIVLTEGCYDFTYHDMRAYSDEAFYYLTTYVDEIREGIANGMTLCYDSEVFMYNHFTLKYRLGTYDDDANFICKREYLIDEYYTLVFNMPDDENGATGWEVVCGGLDLETLGGTIDAVG